MGEYYCNFRFKKIPNRCTLKGVGNAFLECDGENNCLLNLIMVELILQRSQRKKGR